MCDGLVDCDLAIDEDPAFCGLVSLDAPGAPPSGEPTDCDGLAYGACDGVDDCSASAGSAFECDGFQDCPSGQDEAGCP